MALVTPVGLSATTAADLLKTDFGYPIGTIEGAPEAEVRRPGPDGSVRGRRPDRRSQPRVVRGAARRLLIDIALVLAAFPLAGIVRDEIGPAVAAVLEAGGVAHEVDADPP